MKRIVTGLCIAAMTTMFACAGTTEEPESEESAPIGKQAEALTNNGGSSGAGATCAASYANCQKKCNTLYSGTNQLNLAICKDVCDEIFGTCDRSRHIGGGGGEVLY